MLLCPSDSRDYMVMKKLLFMLVALLPAFQGARADNVAQAIWCNGNKTLYFDYRATAVTVGSTYDKQTVTAVYTVSSEKKTTYPDWNLGDSPPARGDATKVVFQESFKTFTPKSCWGWFHMFTQLTSVDGLANLNTSQVEIMDFMFDICSSLENLDVSTFDVSKVTTAESMFLNCSKLTTIYCNKAWNIASTASMFYGAVKLRGYNSSQVTGTMASPAGYFTTKLTETLNNNASSETTISDWVTNHVNEYANVTLSGHTLYKDTYWNTLCLPFSMNQKQIAESPLAGAIIRQLYSADLETSTGTLTLTFSDASSIEAGKPYIVKWTSGADVTSPVFNNVAITSATPEGITFGNKVYFVGQYSPFEIVASGASGSHQGNLDEIILLSGGNKLGYSKNPRTNTNGNALHSFCAHFRVPVPSASVRSFVINFGDDENTTGICVVSNDKGQITNDKWYALDGRELNGKPSAKGLYINNGKKVLIR